VGRGLVPSAGTCVGVDKALAFDAVERARGNLGTFMDPARRRGV